MESTRDGVEECEREYPQMEQALAALVEDGVLAGLDVDGLLGVVVRFARLARVVQYGLYKSLEVLDRHPAYGAGQIVDAAVEVALALHVSERYAQQLVGDARTLTRRFPETLQELGAGNVQTIQVRALIESTANLQDAMARQVQGRVLHLMNRQNPSATAQALRRAVRTVDPGGAQRRLEAANEQRHVTQYAQLDGMATLAATLPAEQAVHAMAVIDAHAREARKQSCDGRTPEQARADSFYTLVTGNAGACPPAVVTVTVGIDTLLGIDQEPAELERHGPITPDTARKLAAGQDALWRRLLTEPETGLVVKTDPYTYRPTAEVRRLVSARDRHCTFPGCAMPASRTDLDHIVPFDHQNPERGGLTVPENLQALCRRHHGLKTRGEWNVRLSETSTTTTPTTIWTAPSGREYAKTA